MSDLFERPPIAQAPISLVLPVWNDDAAVEEVLRGWATHLNGLGRDYEILVVDDASTDRSAALAEAVAAEAGRVQVLRHAEHKGVGAALRTGIAAARHPLLAITDCDSLYQPADLNLLLDAIDKVDVAVGYRVGSAAPPRSLAERLYAGFIRTVFAVRLKDPDCPFKLYRRSVFARIPIQSNGRFVHAEIIAKANFLGCLMTEIALPERTRTRPAPLLTQGTIRERLREARRVFQHPNFGPAVLPAEAAPPPISPVDTGVRPGDLVN
jgi:glycosyltransferase involved in cell wall biosynthesis